MWDQIIDPIAGALGQDADSQVNNLKTGVDGKYKPTLGDRFWGRADEGQDILDAQKNTQLREKYKPQLEALGGQFTDNMSEGSALAEIQSLRDARTQKQLTQQQNNQFYSPQAVDERKIRDRRYYDQQKQNAQLRLDTLAAAERSERREDRRYNERMELEAKKDRRQAMQSLAAGLASLGAAFAL